MLPQRAHADAAHLDAMRACITHQLGRRIKAHGLRVEERGKEGGGLVAFDPATDIDQQREAGGMAFGKAVFTEALDLLEDSVGYVGLIAACERECAAAKLLDTFNYPCLTTLVLSTLQRRLFIKLGFATVLLVWLCNASVH